MLSKFKIKPNSTYEHESKMFILISLLHINGFINDDSLFSNFKLLREKKMIRHVNTYYSHVNNKWYNSEHIVEIYEDILHSKLNPRDKKEIQRIERLNKIREINGLEPKKYKTELNFDETMKYLNFYLNKNRNYCIDHLFHEFLKYNINNYANRVLNSIFEYDFSTVESRYNHFNDDEYCCEYCCGDYDDWDRDRREYNSGIKDKEVRTEISKMISEFLNSKRVKYKGSYKEYVV